MGGSGGFRGGGCGCCLVDLVGVGLVDFFFFVVSCGGGGCGCCLVGLVGVGLVDFFFLCCELWWWWWWLWLCVWLWLWQ